MTDSSLFMEQTAALIADTQVQRRHAYWLIDQSAMPAPWLRAQLARAEWIDMLAGTGTTALNGATPLLVQIDPSNNVRRSAYLARELYRVASMANAVSFLASQQTLAVLQTLLCQRSRVQLPGHVHALLRFFDTRTLPLLPRLFTTAQYAQFMSDIDTWRYLDRWGGLQAMPAAAGLKPASELMASIPLQLDEAQEALLIDDGLTDAVVDLLLTQHHHALQDKSPPQQFDAVNPWVVMSRSVGLREPLQAFAFAAKGLTEGPGFQELEAWKKRLKAYLAGSCTLEALVELK